MKKRSALAFSIMAVLGSFAETTEQPAATGSLSGQIMLPETTPDWFVGKDLDLSQVEVTLLGPPEMPPRPFPEDFEKLSREEQGKWYREFLASEAGTEYRRLSQEAMAKRPRFEFSLDKEGKFAANELPPARYQLTALIPHANAPADRKERMSWALAKKDLNVTADTPTEMEPLTLRLVNVLTPGDLAPEWTANNYEGGEFKLSDFRGKVVLIDFWATWCGPCIAEMPNLASVYQDLGGEKFEIIALSLDKSIEEPKKFLAQKKPAYTQGYLGQWNQSETTSRAYGVMGIPSIWLIDAEGKIIARDLRGEALRQAVQKALE